MFRIRILFFQVNEEVKFHNCIFQPDNGKVFDIQENTLEL